MAKIKRMDQIRSILRTYLDTASIKATAKRLGVSKNTVREYLRRVTNHPLELATALAMSDDELRPVIYAGKAGAAADRQLIFQGKVDHYLKELPRRARHPPAAVRGVQRRLPRWLRLLPVLPAAAPGGGAARPDPAAPPPGR